jgi:hypothetical protein
MENIITKGIKRIELRGHHQKTRIRLMAAASQGQMSPSFLVSPPTLIIYPGKSAGHNA